MNRMTTIAVTGTATAIVLLAIVVVRIIQDLPLLGDAFTSSNSLAVALLVIDAVVLGVVLGLALAAGLIAWRGWRGEAGSRWLGVVVFSLVCGLGFFTASRGAGLAAVVGWMALLFGAAGLVAHVSSVAD
jgi:hypothetical protein